MLSRMIVVCVLALAAAGPSWGQGLEQFEKEFVKVVERVRSSVVQVTASVKGREMTWSGVVLDGEGHIASAGGVLGIVEELRVKFPGGPTVRARRLGFDGVTNLGIIKVKPSEHLRPVTFRTPKDRLRVGSLVVVVGNPFGLSGSVSTGIVSGLGRTIQKGSHLLSDMIQTTAPINPGDSGGLLADSRGRIIGIVTSTFGRSASMENMRKMMSRMMKSPEFKKQTEEFGKLLQKLQKIKDPNQWMMVFLQELAKMKMKAPMPPMVGPQQGPGLSAQGINFVLPASQLRSIADQLIKTGKVVRPFLGVQLVPDRTGLRVESVTEGGPAAAAGLRVDDVLITIDGNAPGIFRLRKKLLTAKPGHVWTLVIQRGTEQKTIKLTLGKK